MASSPTFDSGSGASVTLSDSQAKRTPKGGRNLIYWISSGSLSAASSGVGTSIKSIGSGTVSPQSSRNDVPKSDPYNRDIEIVFVKDESVASQSTLQGCDNPAFSRDSLINNNVSRKKPERLKIEEHGYAYERWNWRIIRRGCAGLALSAIVILIAVAIAFIIVYKNACALNFMWWQGVAIYAVDPRLFYDSGSDRTGDFLGLTRNMQYFSNLGVSVLQINHIMKSEKAPNGHLYVTDYGTMNGNVGTLDDFKRFCDSAHSADLKVILNVPLSRTSKKHTWFMKSREQAGHGVFRDYYIWSSKKPPNKNSSMDTVGNQYYVCFETPEQPALNWDKQEVQSSLLKDLDKFWSQGVDGLYLSDLHLIEASDKTKKVVEIIHNFRKFVDRERNGETDGRDTMLMVSSKVVELMQSSSSEDVASVMSKIDLVETVVQMEQNLTKLVDFVSENTLQSPKVPYPWTCWRLGDMRDHKDMLIGLLIQLIMLPGSVFIDSGLEIGEPAIRTVLSWVQKSARVEIPSTGSAEKNLDFIKTILEECKNSLTLRFNGIKTEDEFLKGFELIVRNNTLILKRTHPRLDKYFSILNYGASTRRTDYSDILVQAEVVLDMRGDEKDEVDWRNVNLKEGDCIVAKQPRV